MIDFDNSYVDFIDSKNSWRTNIKSYLKSDKKEYFLVKECRAELVGKNPFQHPDRYEFLSIVEENGKTHISRISSVDENKETLQVDTPLENKLNLKHKNIKYLSLEDVNEILTSKKNINIFCEIHYEFENRKNLIITKCEYINYNIILSDIKYCQPIMGYVLFILKNKINIAYVVKYIEKDSSGNLEFLLRKKLPLFNIHTGNKIKIIIKKCLNKILFFVKKNEFSEVIRIQNSTIKFFCYT